MQVVVVCVAVDLHISKLVSWSMLVVAVVHDLYLHLEGVMVVVWSVGVVFCCSPRVVWGRVVVVFHGNPKLVMSGW